MDSKGMGIAEAQTIIEKMDVRLENQAKENLARHRADKFYEQLLAVSKDLLSANLNRGVVGELDQIIVRSVNTAVDLINECQLRKKNFLIAAMETKNEQ